MSYCRFSTDDFACDLYAYESQDGFVIHVAGNRVVGEVPKSGMDAFFEAEDDRGAEAFVARMKAQHDFLMDAERVAIDLPYAGQSMTLGDLESFRDRLVELRALGYRFPEGMIVTVEEEIADLPGTGSPDRVGFAT